MANNLNSRLQIRINKHNKMIVKSNANQLNMTVSKYLRYLLVNGCSPLLTNNNDNKMIKQVSNTFNKINRLNNQMSRVGNNINQIAKKLNDNQIAYNYNQVKGKVDSQISKIKEMLLSTLK